MADLVCPSCGTSYDTGGFEPGQRFRCHGDGCSEKLTVPADGVSTEDTPTPAPVEELPRSGGGKRRGTTGKVKTAAPAVAAPVDDDEADVLEAKVPTARARRGSGRGPAAAEPVGGPRGRGGRGGAPPKPASPAPLYAAIGGVVLILLIVIFAMMGKSMDPPPNKPKKPRTPKWKQEATETDTATAPAQPTEPVDVELDKPPEDEQPKTPVKRTRKDWRFVEKDGLAGRLDPLIDGLMDEDPNVGAEAAEKLLAMGPDMIPVMLNHMAGMKFLSMKERTKGYHMLEAIKEHLGWDARDKVGDVGEVNPRDNGAHSFRDAVKAWREYFKGTGAATKDVEVED